MSSDQIQAAYELIVKPSVQAAHATIEVSRGESFEFYGNLRGWVESHAQNAPDQSEPAKIVQGASQNMATEMSSAFLDSFQS